VIFADKHLRSRLAPGLALHPVAEEIVREEVVQPYVSRFFAARGIDEYSEIPATEAFHTLEFSGRNALPISDLYVSLFGGMSRDQNGRLVHSARYMMLLDGECCTETCSDTGMTYASIALAKHPVGFILRLPIEAVLTFLRSEGRRIFEACENDVRPEGQGRFAANG
jgi:hypothetical protein